VGQVNKEGVKNELSMAQAVQHSDTTSHEQTYTTRVRCPFCVTYVADNDGLTVHLIELHGIVNNCCYLCKWQFGSVFALADHLMDKHSVSKNQTCRLCGVKLKTKSLFVTHLSRHAQVKTFRCSYCGKSYYSLNHLNRHKQSCFGVSNPFPCDYCDKGYKSQQALKEHVDAVHSGNSYVCNICGKVFQWKRRYKLHMKQCVAST